jgi:hypothetical protein
MISIIRDYLPYIFLEEPIPTASSNGLATAKMAVQQRVAQAYQGRT